MAAWRGDLPETRENEASHVREENADYFMIYIADIAVIYIAVFTDIARIWDIYVAATHVRVPGDSSAFGRVQQEAFSYALQHPAAVTPGLLDRARACASRKRGPGVLEP